MNTYTIESGYGVEAHCDTWEAAIAKAERLVRSINTTWIILSVCERQPQGGDSQARPMVREQKVTCQLADKK